MKRYDMEDVGPAYHQHTEMIEYEDGHWVYYDDVEALTQLNKELVEALYRADNAMFTRAADKISLRETVIKPLLVKAKELAE